MALASILPRGWQRLGRLSSSTAGACGPPKHSRRVRCVVHAMSRPPCIASPSMRELRHSAPPPPARRKQNAFYSRAEGLHGCAGGPCCRREERVQAAAKRIRTTTGSSRLHTYTADLSDLAEVRALAEAVRADHPQITTLINNAGVRVGGAGARTRRPCSPGCPCRASC